MITERIEHEHGTEILVYADEHHPPYTILCYAFDTDRDGRRVAPTARVSLAVQYSATADRVRRLAAEYAEVADVAEALQAEKRAAYAARLDRAGLFVAPIREG